MEDGTAQCCQYPTSHIVYLQARTTRSRGSTTLEGALPAEAGLWRRRGAPLYGVMITINMTMEDAAVEDVAVFGLHGERETGLGQSSTELPNFKWNSPDFSRLLPLLLRSLTRAGSPHQSLILTSALWDCNGEV